MKVATIFIGTLFSVMMVAYANFYTPMMKGGYGYGSYYPVQSSSSGFGSGFGSGGIFEMIIFLFVFILIIQVLFGSLNGGGGLGGFGGLGGSSSGGYGHKGYHKGGHY